MVHRLKAVQPYFNEVLNGEKTFEVRRFDRDFKVGDSVVLMDYDDMEDMLLGSEITFTISYILSDFRGIQDGYCIIGFKSFDVAML